MFSQILPVSALDEEEGRGPDDCSCPRDEGLELDWPAGRSVASMRGRLNVKMAAPSLQKKIQIMSSIECLLNIACYIIDFKLFTLAS